MLTTRRSLLASLGLALPIAALAVAAPTDASATALAKSHHARKQGHQAHLTHHGKPHRTASAQRPHAPHA